MPNCLFPQTTSKVMNVVWCVVDCLRRDALSGEGYHRETTPALDALRDDCVVFDNAHTQSTFTLSSAASMVTGSYPGAHRTYTFTDRFRTDQATVRSTLAGTDIESSVVSGMNFFHPEWGLDGAVDTAVDLSGAKANRDCGQARADEVVDTFLDTVLTDAPFVSLLWFFDLHTPRLSPPRFGDDSAPRDQYDTELRYVDEQIGRLVDTLRTRGLYDETLLIVTGDHGDVFDEYTWLAGSSVGDALAQLPIIGSWLGGNGYLGHIGVPPYEELTNVPLLVKFPDGEFGGESVTDLVELVDILPTIVDTLSLSVPPSRQTWQGTSLRETLESGADRTAVFTDTAPFDFGGRWRAVRTANHKLMRLTPPGLSRSMRTSPHMAIVLWLQQMGGRSRLYALDAGEQPIADDAVASKLQDRLTSWETRNTQTAGTRSTGTELSPDRRDELRNLGYLE